MDAKKQKHEPLVLSSHSLMPNLPALYFPPSDKLFLSMPSYDLLNEPLCSYLAAKRALKALWMQGKATNIQRHKVDYLTALIAALAKFGKIILKK